METNNTQHTKGPWYQQKTSESGNGIRTQDGFICLMVQPARFHGQDKRFYSDVARNEANARLIAAAPELLEASRELLNALYQYNFACNGYRDGTTISEATAAGDELSKAQDKMFDVIQKATKPQGYSIKEIE